jgi:hypothetical protein
MEGESELSQDGEEGEDEDEELGGEGEQRNGPEKPR